MNRESIEALNLVLATLNLDVVYPAQRELLREAIAAATKSQEQITSLTALCEVQHKLHITAVDMLKPAIEAATIKEREAIAMEFEKRHEGCKHLNNYWLHAANYVRERGQAK